MVLNKPNLQSKDFPSREAEKKMGGEIGIRGSKGSSLIPMDLCRIPLSFFGIIFHPGIHHPFRNASSTNTTAPSSQRILIWNWMVSAGTPWIGFLGWDWNSSTGIALLARR